MIDWNNSLNGKKIFLTEDDACNQELVVDIFEGSGCLIDIANSGDEAIKLVKNTTYDIILMDMHMPFKNGSETVKAIRLYEIENNLKPVHIIALTADIICINPENCDELGMNDYISKPIDVCSFRKKILDFFAGVAS